MHFLIYLYILGWVQEVLLPTHRQRLRESALKVRDVLGSLGIYVRPSSAAFFLWADMRPYMNEISKDGELGKLFKNYH